MSVCGVCVELEPEVGCVCVVCVCWELEPEVGGVCLVCVCQEHEPEVGCASALSRFSHRVPPGSSIHVIFPGRNTGVGCFALLQEIFQPRDRTGVFYVSCIGRQFLYHCATWEAPKLIRQT